MDFLDRYLDAVKKHLPWQRQDDIIAELRANLEAQLEDKEAEAGRPLTAKEIEAWLKKMGAPIQVAGRYYPQQYLIGPTVFPLYWFVLRMALSWAAIIYLIVTGVLLIAGSPSASAAGEAVLRVPFVLMTVAAWVTLVFAGLEFGVTHYASKFQALTGDSFDWSAGALPPVEKLAVGCKKGRSYTQAAAEVIFGFLTLVWLLLIPKHLYLLMGPGAVYWENSPFQLAPIWVQFYWWVVALNILQLVWRSVDLLRGTWRRPWPGQQLVFSAFGLVPIAVLFAARDHALVLLKHSALDMARYGGTLDTINQALRWSMTVVFAISVVQLGLSIGRMGLEAYRKRAATR